VDTIDLLNLRLWVSNYCKTFHSAEEAEQRNIALKETHTYRVAANMSSLSREVLRNRNKAMIAEAIGLLHDIGRFSQYAQYKTFKDNVSVNHGRLGAEVIEREEVLRGLPLNEQQMVVNAVRYHNALVIPAGLDPETIFFLKMIRDADKLDIWRIFAEYFARDSAERESAAGLGLPDTPGYTNSVLACLAERRLASLSSLQTLNDFRITQLTWVYDLNFPASFRLAADQGHIDRIISTLPHEQAIVRAVYGLKQYMRERAAI
jgi:putative nucleotidyltransferase with HDIG domain